MHRTQCCSAWPFFGFWSHACSCEGKNFVLKNRTLPEEMGLRAGIPVGTSLIDAHAGGVGIMESVPQSDSEAKGRFQLKVKIYQRYFISVTTLNEYLTEEFAFSFTLYLILGAPINSYPSSASSLDINFTPMFVAMLPEYWLTEGGQSATGALLDYIIENHMASPHLADRAASQKTSIFALLNNMLLTMMEEQKSPFVAALTESTHVLPDFHGNRSPIADPKSKGIICGLTLDTSERQLALLYLATIQGVAYGTRHIVEHCNAHGHEINTLLACGGLSKNPLYIQEHADIMGCPVILPRESESVLLGAAILGAVAAKKYPTVMEAMKALNVAGQVVRPSQDPKVKKYHDAKYRVFQELYEQQLSQRSAMAKALE
ncbi:unnamed protein product [Linum tenue]|uniref:Carbohydrate kinase FGGY C-terminal domain-containing protein n=1 Tax=Linum tenue TaxID=586396 RepID=A0AAV0IBB2_9ROSI|nr:unnamed protein product [Linum tenue]